MSKSVQEVVNDVIEERMTPVPLPKVKRAARVWDAAYQEARKVLFRSWQFGPDIPNEKFCAAYAQEMLRRHIERVSDE